MVYYTQSLDDPSVYGSPCLSMPCYGTMTLITTIHFFLFWLLKRVGGPPPLGSPWGNQQKGVGYASGERTRGGYWLSSGKRENSTKGDEIVAIS